MKTNHIELQTEMIISASIMEALKYHSHNFWTIHSVFDSGFNMQSHDQIIYFSSFNQSLSAHGILISNDAFTQIRNNLRIGNRVQYKDDFFRFFTQPLILDLKTSYPITIDLSLDNILMTTEDFNYLQIKLAKIDFHNHCDPTLYQKVNQSLMTKERSDHWILDFIGMGHGLTPSGDDFIQGMLIIAMLGEDRSFIKTVKDLISQSSTTDIANAYYDSLFQRQVNQQWHDLFQAVIDRNQRQLSIALKNIQSYGDSSGYDMLFGVYFYLKQVFN